MKLQDDVQPIVNIQPAIAFNVPAMYNVVLSMSTKHKYVFNSGLTLLHMLKGFNIKTHESVAAKRKCQALL